MDNIELENFVIRIRPKLLSICRRFLSTTQLVEEPEDMVQETLLKLWRMRKKIGEYRSPEALAMMVAKNVCIDCQRHSRQHVASTDDNIRVADDERADSRAEGNNMQQLIEQAMARLPRTQQRMLRMRSEGMELDEIAAICNTTRASAKTLISAARRNLTQQLKGLL